MEKARVDKLLTVCDFLLLLDFIQKLSESIILSFGFSISHNFDHESVLLGDLYNVWKRVLQFDSEDFVSFHFFTSFFFSLVKNLNLNSLRNLTMLKNEFS